MEPRKNYDEVEEPDELADQVQKNRGRSIDYEKKRRRAERILEQARLRDMLGFDVDYPE